VTGAGAVVVYIVVVILLSAAAVLAGVILVQARTAPPVRRARRGAREVDVEVRALPRSCDEWPF